MNCFTGQKWVKTEEVSTYLHVLIEFFLSNLFLYALH